MLGPIAKIAEIAVRELFILGCFGKNPSGVAEAICGPIVVRLIISVSKHLAACADERRRLLHSHQ
jgi:hypothetical protein